MRPKNWREMSDEEKTDHAFDLFHSRRGAYVIAQALAIASKILKNKEPSNAQDMEVIGECLFQPFYDLNKQPYVRWGSYEDFLNGIIKDKPDE